MRVERQEGTPETMEGLISQIGLLALPESKGKPCKNIKAGLAGGVVQHVECLPSKCEVQSSNPSTDKEKNGKVRRGKGG
jgi:hypothetical protein